jgi:ABC-type branched-subunit amino acid transport system ATPase component
MSAVLEVRSVTKRFGGLTALSNVEFTVQRGELVGLVGPNGAGKSTLFNIIAGAVPPTSGQVFLNGHDVTRLPSHELARRGIARTYQQVTLFGELSAVDNVRQGLHRHAAGRFIAGLLGTRGFRKEESHVARRALDILEFLGIAAYRDDVAADLPFGIQKLLTVAVALATEPLLLLLDEPAAGLAHEEAARMMNLVATVIRERCTVILVEHNMRIVGGYCDRAVVLHFGQTIYDGEPAGLTADQRVVDAYLGVAELE